MKHDCEDNKLPVIKLVYSRKLERHIDDIRTFGYM